MKPIIFLITMLMLAVAPLSGPAQGTLYPPLNLQGESIECSSYLLWEKPELPGGGTPQGLLGYNVYKEGVFLSYVSGQDTTWAFDMSPQPCPSDSHAYFVTAYYDLAYYGNPGQFGESVSTDTIPVNIICDRPFPFLEPWDQSTFAYHAWSFNPDQGNWGISVTAGNPAPTAVFSGTPVGINYYSQMQSDYVMSDFTQGCMDLFLDFDLKLENLVNSGTEKLIIETSLCGGPTDTVAIFANTSGFDWTHYRYTINHARGTIVRILFTATGENSAYIQQWMIDNIAVTIKCRPPLDVLAEIGDDRIVVVTWNPPVCDMGTQPDWYHLTGYNIYRTDSAGNLPFQRLNAAPVTDTAYYDLCPEGWDPSLLRYYVTDLQHDSTTLTFICESEPSDTANAYYVGIGSEKYTTCNIYPNPNKGIFTADLPPDAVSLEIANLEGRIILSEPLKSSKGERIRIDISGQPAGMYLLTVVTGTGIARAKVLIN